MEAYIAAILLKKSMGKQPPVTLEPTPNVSLVHEQELIDIPIVVAPVPEPIVVAPVPEPIVVAPVPEPIVVVPVPEPIVVVPEPIVVVPEPIEPAKQTNPLVPKIIFIVPYRDRPQQLHFFQEQMKKVLSMIPKNEYKIYYLHQDDTRKFNRGAMKNIGYLVVKRLYPADYKNITLVFNDVDTMPYIKNFLKYDTKPGIVKHFYGFKRALGGIVSITAGDFEKTTGFPNFWAWGYEDNTLKRRVDEAHLTIDYTQFYPIRDGNILQLKDGDTREVSRIEYDSFLDNASDNFTDISGLMYNIVEETGFINVTAFNTKVPDGEIITHTHDLARGLPFIGRRRGGQLGRMFR